MQRIHKWKEKVEKNAKFPFVDKRKLFVMKLSLEGFNIVFFTARGRLACFESLNQGKEVFEETSGSF